MTLSVLLRINDAALKQEPEETQLESLIFQGPSLHGNTDFKDIHV